MNVLECSRLGDVRFTAEEAKVEVYGEWNSIFNHYQMKKRFLSEAGEWQTMETHQSGGIRPLAFKIGSFYLPTRYGTMYYILLWLKFLESHPELVDYLAQFDDYLDSTKQGNWMTGADIIRMYFQAESGIKYPPHLRGKALKDYCQPLSRVLKEQVPLSLTPKDLEVGFDCLLYTGKIFD